MTVSLYFCDPWWKIFGQRRNSEDLKNKIEANSVICCKIWDSFGCRKYCQYYWFGTKMLRSKTDLFSFRSYIYHMTKMDRIHIFENELNLYMLFASFPSEVLRRTMFINRVYTCSGEKAIFVLKRNLYLFWREIYISRQLNLFLRTMFVVVGLFVVTTTLRTKTRTI